MNLLSVFIFQILCVALIAGRSTRDSVGNFGDAVGRLTYDGLSGVGRIAETGVRAVGNIAAGNIGGLAYGLQNVAGTGIRALGQGLKAAGTELQTGSGQNRYVRVQNGRRGRRYNGPRRYNNRNRRRNRRGNRRRYRR